MNAPSIRRLSITALLCATLGACAVVPSGPPGYYPRTTVIESYPTYYQTYPSYPTVYYGGSTVYYRDRSGPPHRHGDHGGPGHGDWRRDGRDRTDRGDRGGPPNRGSGNGGPPGGSHRGPSGHRGHD